MTMPQIVNKKVRCKLVGRNGNAWVLLGAFSEQARREKWTDEEIDAVCKEAMSGDYRHLLATLADHCVGGGGGSGRGDESEEEDDGDENDDD